MFRNPFSKTDEYKEVDFLETPEMSQPSQTPKIDEQTKDFGSEKNRDLGRLTLLEMSRIDIKPPTEKGWENVPNIPCVIATTHLSDIDVQEVAMVVARKRKVGIASQLSNLADPLFKPFVKMIGKDNFFPISNKLSTQERPGEEGEKPKKQIQNRYNVEESDLTKLKDGIINDGRTMIVAGHNPTHDWELPPNPGMAALLLAHLAKRPLVTATVRIDSPTPVGQSTDLKPRLKNLLNPVSFFKRPKAEIIFSSPMELANLSEDELKDAMALYDLNKRKTMSPEQLNKAQQTMNTLQTEGEKMMDTFASNLPPERNTKRKNIIENKKRLKLVNDEEENKTVEKIEDVREQLGEEISSQPKNI